MGSNRPIHALAVPNFLGQQQQQKRCQKNKGKKKLLGDLCEAILCALFLFDFLYFFFLCSFESKTGTFLCWTWHFMPWETSVIFDFCNIYEMWDARMRFESRHCKMHRWTDWWRCWSNRATLKLTSESRSPTSVREMEWTSSKWKTATSRQRSRRPPCWASVRPSFHVSSTICVWAFVFHCSANDFCPDRMHMIPILMFDCDKNAHFVARLGLAVAVAAAVAVRSCMSNIYRASTHCEWWTLTLINRPIRTVCDANRPDRTIFANNYFECCGCLSSVPPICVVDSANSRILMSGCRNRCHRHWFSPMPVRVFENATKKQR